jgi:hypothetical protein
MRRNLLLSVALLATVAFGVAEGIWAGRWSPSDDLDRAAARVADVPRVVGEWEGTDRELDAREVQVGRLRGHLMRTYTHRQTGESVAVMVLCGQPGPIAAHTPDVCFQGQGMTMAGQPARRPIPAAGATPAGEFWAARFDRPGGGVDGSSLAVWGWSVGTGWEAAESPRVRYARSRFLYKLYVIRALTVPGQPGADDHVLTGFLADFLPAAQVALFPADASR